MHLLAALSLTIAPLAFAQDSEPPRVAAPPAPGVTAPRATFPRATRADLAAAYLRLERALAARPPSPDRIADLNKRFDQASLAFFSGRFGSAIETLNALTAETEGKSSPELALARSLAVRVPAAVGERQQSGGASLMLRSMFAPPAPQADLVARFTSVDGSRSTELRVPVDAAAAVDLHIPIGPTLLGLARGSYRVELGPKGGPFDPVARFSIVSPLAPVRTELQERLKAFTPETPAQERAKSIAAARASLLSDEPSPDNSAQFLADMHDLLLAVTAEADSVVKGGNPYANLAGDHWRVVGVGDANVPCRVYAPAKVAKSAVKVPLVIAYHGAGGDESMFFEGYGAGKIKILADEHGFVCAAPLTISGSSAEAFDALVGELSADYPIDPDRIYVLGHSMGAGATAALASSRNTRIAAACCLAGGGSFRGPIAPTLVISGDLDPLIPPSRLRPAAQAAVDRGLPITLEIAEGWGHTLVVGHKLPRALDFLLAHKLADRSPK